MGEEYDFSQSVYGNTPAAAIASNLSLDQDAARVNQGAPWRMPASEEYQELYDNCTHVWATMNGVDGVLFTSNVNGNTLFFPAAGGYNGTSLQNYGSGGRYWSSTFYNATRANFMLFDSAAITPQYNGNRHLGFSVRAVMPSL